MHGNTLRVIAPRPARCTVPVLAHRRPRQVPRQHDHQLDHERRFLATGVTFETEFGSTRLDMDYLPPRQQDASEYFWGRWR